MLLSVVLFPLSLFICHLLAHPPKSKVAIPRILRHCFDENRGAFAFPHSLEEELSVSASCTLVNRLSSAKIVDMIVKSGTVICILDNGVLEAYRFGMSNTAKFLVNNYKRETNWEGNNSDFEGLVDDGGLGNLISFEELDSSTVMDARGNSDGAAVSLVELLEGRRAAENTSNYTVSSFDIAPPNLDNRTKMAIRGQGKTHVRHRNDGSDCCRDVLIAVEKEYLHFKEIQRVPVAREGTVASDKRNVTNNSSKVCCTAASDLVFCYGRADGGVRYSVAVCFDIPAPPAHLTLLCS